MCGGGGRCSRRRERRRAPVCGSAATGGMQLCGAAALSSKHVQRAAPASKHDFHRPCQKARRIKTHAVQKGVPQPKSTPYITICGLSTRRVYPLNYGYMPAGKIRKQVALNRCPSSPQARHPPQTNAGRSRRPLLLCFPVHISMLHRPYYRPVHLRVSATAILSHLSFSGCSLCPLIQTNFTS